MTRTRLKITGRIIDWRGCRRLRRATAHLDNHLRCDIGLPLIDDRRHEARALLLPYLDI